MEFCKLLKLCKPYSSERRKRGKFALQPNIIYGFSHFFMVAAEDLFSQRVNWLIKILYLSLFWLETGKNDTYKLSQKIPEIDIGFFLEQFLIFFSRIFDIVLKFFY